MKTIDMNKDDIKDELQGTSPFIAGLNKKNPYKTPQGYFEQLQLDILKNKGNNKSIVKMNSPAKAIWKYGLIAAALTGIFLSAFFLFMNRQSEESKIWDQIAAIEDSIMDEYLDENILYYDDYLLTELVPENNNTELIEINFENIDSDDARDFIWEELSLDEIEELFL
jgi:hypothetical protein